jgi:hypothetical protein
MASQTKVERQHVYTTYREYFHGKPSRAWKRKALCKIILKHETVPGMTVDDSHVNRIVPVLKALLKDHVFQSEDQAKREFPGLFLSSSPVRHTNIISRQRNAPPGKPRDIARTVRDGGRKNLNQRIPRSEFFAILVQ